MLNRFAACVFAALLVAVVLIVGLTGSPPRSAAGSVGASDFAATKYLVLNDPGCSPTQIALNPACWSAVSGGSGGAGVPMLNDFALADGNSGTRPASQGGSMAVGALSLAGYSGVWHTGPYSLTTSSASSGILVQSGLLDTSGGQVRTRELFISGASVQVGTGFIGASGMLLINRSGNLLLDHGFVFAGDVFVGDPTDSASYLDLGSGYWNMTGNLTSYSTSPLWNAGTGDFILSGLGTQILGGGAPQIALPNLRVSGGEKLIATDLVTSNVTASGSNPVLIRFAASSVRWTVRAGSILSGGPKSLLVLRGADINTAWEMDALGKRLSVVAHFVDVQRCNAKFGGTILANDGTNVDSGFNRNWKFR